MKVKPVFHFYCPWRRAGAVHADSVALQHCRQYLCGWLGTEALTAVSLVCPLQNIVLSFPWVWASGINSVIARRLGEQAEEANKAASIGMGRPFCTAF